MLASIYTLRDPETFGVRYVGQTTMTLGERLRRHRNEKRSCYTTTWIASLKKRGLLPVIQLEVHVPIRHADGLEKHYIRYYRSIGCDLTNHDEGGRVNRLVSQETRDKLSRAKKGIPNPHPGHPVSEETRRRISTSLIGNQRAKGCIQGAETRAKKSEALKGREQSPSHVVKRATALMGHAHSKDTRAKQSAAKKGKPWSEARRAAGGHSSETKGKIAAAKRGKPWSPARRAAYEAKLASTQDGETE